jgi:hypothetical protein
MLIGKRKIGSAENGETNNHKTDMSGMMQSVTEKAWLFWLPADNYNIHSRISKYIHTCIREKVEGKVVPVQTTKANGGVEIEVWLLKKERSSRKYFINEGIITTLPHSERSTVEATHSSVQVFPVSKHPLK